VGIFAILSSTVVVDVLHQLFLALSIVFINSVIIPLFKFLIKKVKEKYNSPSEINRMLDEFEKLSVEELNKLESILKEKIKKESDEK
jgi:hypothetical protein